MPYAVDRLADLFAATYPGWWEWAARRDPILARLGLAPDQCAALVALLAPLPTQRQRDSLLAAVRAATEHGTAVELSALQRRRICVYTRTAGNGAVALPHVTGRSARRC